MDKCNNNKTEKKNEKSTEKGMNRTEFADEMELGTDKSSNNNKKTNKQNQK